MFIRTETMPSKKLIGFSLKMSLANNKTFELWRKFMPRRKEIKNIIGNDMLSIQVYNKNYDPSDQNAEFEKWAVLAVTEFENVPDEMETIILPEGKYAVFLHKGPASKGHQTFKYIFGTWLPNSGYRLDNRPHFEILGEKYKNNELDSEEEVWIPIK